MSDAPRAWRFYIDDMIAFAERVVLYTDGFDQAAFSASGLDYDATLRNLELIGKLRHIFRMRFVLRIRTYPGDLSSRHTIASFMDISASITTRC